MTCVEALNVPDAIEIAQALAQEAAGEGEPEAWFVLFVCGGQHENIRDQGIRQANVPLTEAEIDTMRTILADTALDGTRPEAQLKHARSIFIKLRHAELTEA
ncbi:MAG TPA: hypothetical protein VK741_21730 [Acetobacteraceae bacterium]|nr:hypothetical protein [Acetobacteraceae bacterium]